MSFSVICSSDIKLMSIPKIYRDPALQRAFALGYAYALGYAAGQAEKIVQDARQRPQDEEILLARNREFAIKSFVRKDGVTYFHTEMTK